MIDAGYKQAYEKLLKENVRLNAVNKTILDSAEKTFRKADEEINKLHRVIEVIIDGFSETCMKWFPDIPERAKLIEEIKKLTPMKIGADGKDKNAGH